MFNDLKLIRKKYNLTQKELSRILGISQASISRIEKEGKIPENLSKKIISIFYSDKISANIEKESLEIYQLMRDTNNPYSRIASINRTLINLNQAVNEATIQLNYLSGDTSFLEIKHKVKRQIKTTIKTLQKAIYDLENIINNTYIEVEED